MTYQFATKVTSYQLNKKFLNMDNCISNINLFQFHQGVTFEKENGYHRNLVRTSGKKKTN